MTSDSTDPRARLHRQLPTAAMASRWLLGLAVVVLAVMPLVGIFAMTLGIDEAWNLLGYKDVATGVSPQIALGPPKTSIGLYALVHATWFRLGFLSHEAHRVLIYGAFLLIAGGLFVTQQPRKVGWIALLPVAGLLAVPGTLHLASVAYAEMYAMSLLLLTVAAWSRWSDDAGRSWPMLIAVAGLAGLTVSTRLSMAGLLPVLLLATLVIVRPIGKSVIACVVVAAIAAVIVLGMGWTLDNVLAPDSSAHNLDAAAGGTTSLAHYQRIFTFLGRGNAMISFVLAAGVGVWWIARWLGGKPVSKVAAVLQLFFWATLLLWAAKSPIAQMRYLWPASAGLFIAAGLLARVWILEADERQRPARWLAVSAVLLIGLGTSFVESTRQLLYGNTDAIAWEYSGESISNIFFGRGDAKRDQQAAAEALRGYTDAGEIVATPGVAYPMRFLAGGDVVGLVKLRDGSVDSDGVRYVLLGTEVGSYMQLAPEAVVWLAENTTLVARAGGYSIYEIDQGVSIDTDALHTVPRQFTPHPD